jgi:vacuolar-type H+-ATPase subunit H
LADIVKDVLLTEKKAESIVKAAEKRKIALIEGAKRSSLSKLTEKKKEIDSKREGEIQKKRQELEQKKKAISEEGQKSANSLTRISEKKIPKVINYVMREFERRLK